MTDDETLERIVEEAKSAISEARLQNPKKSIGFMIGTTSAKEDIQTPYRMPVRQTDDWILFGVVVFSQSQAIVAAHLIDGLVDTIFVDTEKKLPVRFEPDHSLLAKYGIKTTTSNSDVEFGNISAACQTFISKSQYYKYKANDLTVDAVFYYLSWYFGELSGKKIVIYGTGNTGNKLALKLVESGANIYMCSNRPQRASVVIDALNQIKSRFALSNVLLAHEPLFASHDADAIVGCTNGIPVITEKMITVMKHSGILIDLGKGTIFPAALKLCNERGIRTWLVDTYATIIGMIMGNTATNLLVTDIAGRKEVEDGLFLVAGGHIGEKYDVIVDSISKPSRIIGVCDAPGRVMSEHDDTARTKILAAEAFLTRNNSRLA